MTSIKQILDILPISYKDRYINVISFANIDDYLKILRSNWYNEYLDFNFMTDVQEDKLSSILYNIIVEYNMKIESPGNVRLILMDKYKKHIIGGCTIFERKDKESIDLAYFIVPKYQNKGDAYNMMIHIIDALNDSKLNFKYFRLTIQCTNTASLKLAAKLGFNCIEQIKGKYTLNYVMRLERRIIHDTK